MEVYFRKLIICTGIVLFQFSGHVSTGTCDPDSYFNNCPGLYDDHDEEYCCERGSYKYCCDYNDKYTYPSDGEDDELSYSSYFYFFLLLGVLLILALWLFIRKRRYRIQTRSSQNQTVVATSNPSNVSNSRVVRYAEHSPLEGNLWVNVDPPLYGPQNPVTGNPTVRRANLPASANSVAPPSYKEATSVQMDQLRTPATAPSMPSDGMTTVDQTLANDKEESTKIGQTSANDKADSTFTGQTSTNDEGVSTYIDQKSANDEGAPTYIGQTSAKDEGGKIYIGQISDHN